MEGKTKDKKFCLLMLICLLISIQVSSNQSIADSNQNYYFVSQNGDNNNSGDFNNPFRSIQYGIDQLSAGDELYIRNGKYHEKLYISCKGTYSKPIKISAFNNEEVIIDGSIWNKNEMDFYGQALIYLDNVSYINISNIKIHNAAYAGISNSFSRTTRDWADENFYPLSHVEIYNCTFYWFNKSAIGIFHNNISELDEGVISNNITISHCDVSHVNRDGGGEGISISARDSTISYCHVYETPKENIDLHKGCYNINVCHNLINVTKPYDIGYNTMGIYCDAGNYKESYIYIHDNWIWDNHSGDNPNFHGNGIQLGHEGNGSHNNVYIYNNIISGTNCGICISDFNMNKNVAEWECRKDNITIVHNTIYDVYDESITVGVGANDSKYTNLIIKNNILAHPDYYYHFIAGGNLGYFNWDLYEVDNNLQTTRSNGYGYYTGYHGTNFINQWISNTTDNAGFKNAHDYLRENPDAKTGPFHENLELNENSIALDVGANLNEFYFDFNRNTRVDNKRDIGAYEFFYPWDLDNNNVIDIYDLQQIAHRFGEFGTNGWIIEDFDMNGIIQVKDLLFVANKM